MRPSLITVLPKCERERRHDAAALVLHGAAAHRERVRRDASRVLRIAAPVATNHQRVRIVDDVIHSRECRSRVAWIARRPRHLRARERPASPRARESAQPSRRRRRAAAASRDSRSGATRDRRCATAPARPRRKRACRARSGRRIRRRAGSACSRRRTRRCVDCPHSSDRSRSE